MSVLPVSSVIDTIISVFNPRDYDYGEGFPERSIDCYHYELPSLEALSNNLSQSLDGSDNFSVNNNGELVFNYNNTRLRVYVVDVKDSRIKDLVVSVV